MSISFPGLPRGYRYPQQHALTSFAGGVNNRDAASELAANEVIDAWNVTFDERGGASSRLGFVKYNGTPYGADLIQNEYWSPQLGAKIVNAGTKLYMGTSNTVNKTFSAAARVTFAEMAGKVVACHPIDGLFTSTDGVTWVVVADADAPKGQAVCVWQNKLFVAVVGGSRIMWSAAGDPTSFVVTDFVDLREKDNEQVVAMHIGSGQDILGRPGLLCFKQESTYRIHDSSTGAYETVDATVGAASAISVVGVGSRVFALSKRGIFSYGDGQVGMTDVSGRYQRLWASDQVNLAQQDKWCAGRTQNRARFSLTRAGSTANDLALELHTEQGWIAPGSNAMSCYSTSTGAAEATYGGSASVAGQSYLLNTGGTDDGASITGWMQTRWMDLLGGYKASVLHVRVRGRGTGTVSMRTDYADSGSDQPLNMAAPTSRTYDSGLAYDSGLTYYEPADQVPVSLFGVGACRQLSLKFMFTVSTTVSAPQILGAGSAPQVGAFGIFQVEALYMRLGIG